MNLGENIYRFRTEHNMSQGDLADALDVSRQSVSKWENNNAVPELDKLMKMSELFGVTLDELVSGEKSISSESAPVSHSPFPKVPTRKIVGCILFACAFLVFLFQSFLGGSATGTATCIPLLLCGVACFIFKRHTGVWCAWALYLPMSLIPLREFVRIDIAFVTTVCVQLPMLIYTVVDYRREPLAPTKKTTIPLFLGYVLCLLYFLFKIYNLLYTEPKLFSGYDLEYISDIIAFPLLSWVLATTLRLFRKK